MLLIHFLFGKRVIVFNKTGFSIVSFGKGQIIWETAHLFLWYTKLAQAWQITFFVHRSEIELFVRNWRYQSHIRQCEFVEDCASEEICLNIFAQYSLIAIHFTFELFMVLYQRICFSQNFNMVGPSENTCVVGENM